MPGLGQLFCNNAGEQGDSQRRKRMFLFSILTLMGTTIIIFLAMKLTGTGGDLARCICIMNGTSTGEVIKGGVDENIEVDLKAKCNGTFICSGPGNSEFRRLKLQGWEERIDSVILYTPNRGAFQKGQLYVYFGGGIQDEPEAMLKHNNQRFFDWNLEKTAQMISKNNLDIPVLVIKPSKMLLGTVACFPNYVKVEDTKCNPLHESLHNSLLHLQSVLHGLSKHLEKDIFDLSLTLISFSKGCVVLNQLLHELHFYSTVNKTGEVERLLTSVKRMVWLDCGHSGGKHIWITDADLLGSLAKAGIKVDVVVTPFQVLDDRRPWIGKEEKVFCNTLSELGVPIRRHLAYGEEEPSFDFHFKVLSTFQDFLSN